MSKVVTHTFNEKKVKSFNNTVTVCKLNVHICIPEDSWSDKLTNRIHRLLRSYKEVTNYNDKQHYLTSWRIDITTKAFKSPNDVFDATVGERVAESRAKKILYSILMNISTICNEYYSELSNTLYNNTKRYLNLYLSERNHANDLINGIN